jgi:hypothetical protein
MLRRPQTLAGAFTPGETIAAAAVATAPINCAGSGRVRVRFKASAAGVLRLAPLRPNSTEEAGGAVEVATEADVEAVLTVADLAGETFCRLTFTNAGAPSKVTYADVYQRPEPGGYDELFERVTERVAADASLTVDVRGTQGLLAYFGGSCSAQPLRDAAGNTLAGAPPAEPLESGVLLPPRAHFYAITPVGGPADVVVVA